MLCLRFTGLAMTKPLTRARYSVDQSFPKVTRVEVIEETGRAYSRWDVCDVTIVLQDRGRTLKLFCRDSLKMEEGKK